jgi:polyhydroxyalkanoate synthesis regulator phasin
MGRVEERFDKVALRSELVQLKSRVDGLQETIRQMEARLDE